MSYRPWEESAQDAETPNPVTATKPPRHAGAGQDYLDAEISECQYDSNEPHCKKKRSLVYKQKRERYLTVYVGYGLQVNSLKSKRSSYGL
jgi:hypothetical protein